MHTTHERDTDPGMPAIPAPERKRFPVPWGLVAALGIYALAVLGYAWATWWRTSEYQSAVHYTRAREALGREEGRTLDQAELTEAYRDMLEAARLKPEVRSFHEILERLNWRFDERGWKVPEDLRNASEAVAGLWQRIQQERKPILVVGVRDRGWAPDQLVEGPVQLFRWSPVGGLFVVAIWAFLRFSAKRVREEEREAQTVALERELEERQRERERVTRRAPPPRRQRP